MKSRFTLFALALLFALLLPDAALVAATIQNEYWIGTNPPGPGAGTLADPYDVSTQEKFDSVMNNTMLANYTIHVLPGTYETKGQNSLGVVDWALKTGQKLIGSGIDKTVIKLIPATDLSIVVAQLAIGNREASAQDIEVRDLTVNCNYPTGLVGTLNGVNLVGQKHAIRRVKVINAAATSSAPNCGTCESFVITISAGTDAESPGNIIEDCEVTNCHGSTVITAFGFGGGGRISGIMRNNRVIVSPSQSPTVQAFNHGNCRDILITGNYADGAASGVYADTGRYTNVIISHNVFKNCTIGINFNLDSPTDNPATPADDERATLPPVDTLANYAIVHNHIEIRSGICEPHAAGIFTYNTSIGGTGTSCDWPSALRSSGLTIIGNTIQYYGGSGANGWSVDLRGTKGALLANNVIDTNMFLSIGYCSKNISFFNNFDLTGNPVLPYGQALCGVPNPLIMLTSIEPPNGTVRREVSGSSYSLLYSDRYIGVRSAGMTLTLPSAAGHSGRHFIIVDESGNASPSITIQRSGSETINNTTAVFIQSAFGVKELISDDSKWFAW